MSFDAFTTSKLVLTTSKTLILFFYFPDKNIQREFNTSNNHILATNVSAIATMFQVWQRRANEKRANDEYGVDFVDK